MTSALKWPVTDLDQEFGIIRSKLNKISPWTVFSTSVNSQRES